jgi:ribosomal protein S27AE
MTFHKKELMARIRMKLKQLSAKSGLCPWCGEHAIKAYENGRLVCLICPFETNLNNGSKDND